MEEETEATVEAVMEVVKGVVEVVVAETKGVMADLASVAAADGAHGWVHTAAAAVTGVGSARRQDYLRYVSDTTS